MGTAKTQTLFIFESVQHRRTNKKPRGAGLRHSHDYEFPLSLIFPFSCLNLDIKLYDEQGHSESTAIVLFFPVSTARRKVRIGVVYVFCPGYFEQGQVV